MTDFFKSIKDLKKFVDWGNEHAVGIIPLIFGTAAYNYNNNNNNNQKK